MATTSRGLVAATALLIFGVGIIGFKDFASMQSTQVFTLTESAITSIAIQIPGDQPFSISRNDSLLKDLLAVHVSDWILLSKQTGEFVTADNSVICVKLAARNFSEELQVGAISPSRKYRYCMVTHSFPDHSSKTRVGLIPIHQSDALIAQLYRYKSRDQVRVVNSMLMLLISPDQMTHLDYRAGPNSVSLSKADSVWLNDASGQDQTESVFHLLAALSHLSIQEIANNTALLNFNQKSDCEIAIFSETKTTPIRLKFWRCGQGKAILQFEPEKVYQLSESDIPHFLIP